MRWMRGSALFLAGTLVGILIMATTASPQKKLNGPTLNHFGLYVKDMDESANFYREKVGFRKAFSFTDGAGHPVVYLQIDHNTFLEMTPADKDHPAGFSHAGILSDDVESTVAALQKKGLKGGRCASRRNQSPHFEYARSQWCATGIAHLSSGVAAEEGD